MERPVQTSAELLDKPLSLFSGAYLGMIFLALVSLLAVPATALAAGQEAPAITLYVPPPAIVQLAERLGLTEQGRQIFYKTRPQFVDRAGMRAHCPVNEKLSTLGCFSSRDGIFLFKVELPELAGFTEGVAAHELLHAYYNQLNEEERARLSGMLNKLKLGNDSLLHLTNYREQSKQNMEDELHSIVGTDTTVLTPELEAHYAKIFFNRQKIIGFQNAYKSVITNHRAQLKRFDEELLKRKNELDLMKTRLTSEMDDIERAKRERSVEPEILNSRIDKFNDDRLLYRSMITAYNGRVSKNNEAAMATIELLKAMDTHAPTEPKQ